MTTGGIDGGSIDSGGARVVPLAGPVSVRVLRERTVRDAEITAAIDAAWERLVAHNPRYFNGAILSFERYDSERGVITARVEEYKAHAVRLTVDSGIDFLGVTAILRAPGADGVARFMLGRRGERVHDYPGQWEFGPCGGVDPPGGDGLLPEDINREAAREAAEEAGVSLADARVRHLALVHDGPAIGSTDLMVLVDFVDMPQTTTGWEYGAVRWVTMEELVAWCLRSPGEVIPTTRAVVAWMSGR